ncbi:MAG: TonB-dependent receptor [Sulfurospirillaceae bacterium]|nr:TonB-dependent receptor [Sulfurospirillaceae bacterium]
MKKVVLVSLIAAAHIVVADSVFTLGEISIQDNQQKVLDVTKLSSDSFKEVTNNDTGAILDTLPGVVLERKGGRNESSILLRGMDARRIGVFLDGIPLYIPYDGNFDYSRILSNQLSSIQVAKGFSSVMYGANTMAGVINMVTKKPTKEFEGSISSEVTADNNFERSSTTNTISLGSKQEKYYFYIDGTYYDRDHWNVSDDFTPTSLQGSNQRLRSSSDSKTLNLKFALTPDDSSEYVFGYNYINSTKEQPLLTDNTLGTAKYWNWPAWDEKTLYFIANKTFSGSALKYKLYRSQYDNTLDIYTNKAFTTLSDTEITDAYSLGTSLEYTNFEWLKNNIIKASIGAKKDHHTIERTITNEDDFYVDYVYSLGLEDTYQPTDKLKIITSLGYDYSNAKDAITANTSLDTQAHQAFNPQIGFFYDFFENQTTRLLLSQKSHLPSMKERFSYKRSKAIPNPDLDPEVADHIELGHTITRDGFVFDNAIFYTKVKDAINIVENVSGTKSQEQNTGTEYYYGFESSIKYIADKFVTGLNYSYIDIDKATTKEVVLDVPKQQVDAYINYSPIKVITLGASISYKEDITADTKTAYQTISDIFTANISAKYQYTKALSFKVGVSNLFDKNYTQYDLGYPEAGREYYAKVQYDF